MQPDPSWTKGRPCTAANEGLHETVARVARSRPGAVALIAGDRTITYAELDRTADAWAAALVADGVGRGDRVPILLPRGPELVTALLATLKAGAAYALLDPAWPLPRLQEVTDQLGASLLVSGKETIEQPWLPVWSPPSGPVAAVPGFRPVAVDGSDPCCVFFTSGTTGQPKGVLSPHRATARLFPVDGFARFGPGTVMPLAAPVPWDAFSLELWSVLLTGGTSVIVDEPYLSGQWLRAGVARHGVNTVWLTSSLFNMIVDEDLGAFTGLGQVMIGGERLSSVHVGRFVRRHPSMVLLNGYGPVESTVFATTHRITEADCERPGGVPLGRPVPGTRIQVLDGTRPCAVGETGEICLGGKGLALHYLGDPGLTSAKFTGDGADRLYRTGDLGVWDADGLLHYRGRADRQLKIRGHRIEPADVERQVERLLPVRSCRVLARRDDTGAAVELLAFCVPAERGDPLPDASAVLRPALLPHQRPAAVVSVDAFPVTAQGKLDERALLAMAPVVEVEPVARVEHADSMVRLVAETFCTVLGRAAVPLDVSLLDLGGGSLAAGRVCARLAAALNRPVPVSRLYEHPTADAFAGWLRGTDLPASPVTTAGEVPLTPMQLVYLTRHLMDPADLTSHCLLTWVIDGEPDLDRLESAIGAVHRRHPALRSAYLADPRPVARLVDIEPPPLEILPTAPSADAAVRDLRALLSEELSPGDGDVWRTALVPCGSGAVFGCVVHHIAFDGWSESVLARDLAAAHNGVALPEVARALPTVHTELDAYRDHLRTELTGVPAVRWPAGSTAPGAPGLVEVALSPEIVAAVDARARAAGVSRFVVLLAEHAATLTEVTGQSDFAVGVPVAQRHGAGLEGVVGCHINMVCVRFGSSTAGLDGTGRAVRRAFAAQDVPFAEVLRIVDPPRTARPPLFQVLFALQDNEIPHLRLAGSRTAFVRQPYLDLPLELHTELWPEEDGGLRLTVYFRPDAVPETVAQDLAKRFADRLGVRP